MEDICPVRLKTIELNIDWPDEITLFSLRNYLIGQIEQYGQPLRWAITEIQPLNMKTHSRRLKLEAVVVIPTLDND